jgi:RNA-binding protein 8A
LLVDARVICVAIVLSLSAVEGFILIVTGLHEESSEDELYELFADHGDVKQLHLNLDRRTGYVKGYALVEFAEYKQALAAMQELQGHELHEKALTVDWAFMPPVGSGHGASARGGARAQRHTVASVVAAPASHSAAVPAGRGPRVVMRGPQSN